MEKATQLVSIISSIRFLAVACILGLAVYVGELGGIEAVQALLATTVLIGTVDRAADSIGGYE